MSDEYKKRLIQYFKKNLRKGYTEDSLRWALVNQGYSRPIIENALQTATRELAEEAPLVKEKPVIKHEVLDEKNRPVPVKKKNWFSKIFG